MEWDGGKAVTKERGEGTVEYPRTKDTGFGIRQPGFLVITMSLLANHFTRQASSSLLRCLHLRVINEKEADVCYKSVLILSTIP